MLVLPLLLLSLERLAQAGAPAEVARGRDGSQRPRAEDVTAAIAGLQSAVGGWPELVGASYSSAIWSDVAGARVLENLIRTRGASAGPTERQNLEV